MKNILIILLLSLLSNSNFAQTASNRIPISIGYFSFLGFQPGAKIGTAFQWKKWETETEKFTKHKSFFISPQIGFFTRPNIHTSYLVNADLGYKRVKSHKQRYSAWSIGLAYLNQSQITSWQVRLTDGTKEKVRENWSWFLPTVNYEFGQAINERIDWYSKVSYGLKMASTRANAEVFFVELGVKVPLMR